jgi:hypothetical protein
MIKCDLLDIGGLIKLKNSLVKCILKNIKYLANYLTTKENSPILNKKNKIKKKWKYN